MLELKKDEKQTNFNIGSEVINVDACKSTYKKQSIITAALQNAYNEIGVALGLKKKRNH